VADGIDDRQHAWAASEIRTVLFLLSPHRRAWAARGRAVHRRRIGFRLIKVGLQPRDSPETSRDCFARMSAWLAAKSLGDRRESYGLAR